MGTYQSQAFECVRHCPFGSSRRDQVSYLGDPLVRIRSSFPPPLETIMAASASRLSIDDADADMVFEPSQSEPSGCWDLPEEPDFGLQTVAGSLSMPKAAGHEIHE